MTNIPVDLTTVEYVSVRGNQHTVEKGSFRLGRPAFTMLDEDGNHCTYLGSNMHPLSFFFTLADSGKQVSGPFEQVTSYVHDTQPPEPKPKEPKHELLPVGTRVLVSDWFRDRDGIRRTNPVAGRISGYNMHRTKYRWQREYSTDHYASEDSWAYADNRVTVHPDGPKCPPAPQPVREEPTGHVLYVERFSGKQGRVLEVGSENGKVRVRVEWFTPGTQPVWIDLNVLKIIPAEDVNRCPNGQTRDECASGENQCEPCLQAEDEEGDEIERSMGLR
jgi:hypothetical protein